MLLLFFLTPITYEYNIQQELNKYVRLKSDNIWDQLRHALVTWSYQKFQSFEDAAFLVLNFWT